MAHGDLLSAGPAMTAVVARPRPESRARRAVGTATSAPSRVRNAAFAAVRWLVHNTRVALTGTTDVQDTLQAQPRALRTLIRSNRIALVTTRDRRGVLHTQPMEASDREFDGELWFAAAGASSVVSDLLVRPDVQVTYVDAASTRALVLDGIAHVCARPGHNGPPLQSISTDDAHVFIRVDVVSADLWE